MKKITAIALFLSFTVTVNAQEDIYKTIAQETCDCVSKRGIDTSKRNEVEIALGLCMLESIQAHDVDVQLTDEAAMTAFGEKVGLQMAPICPLLFSAFMGDAEEEGVEVLELAGKVKSIEMDEFLFIILKDDSGKEHKLLWFRYFPGSDDFKSDPKKLVGKSITVVYENQECYFPKTKTYRDSKEIRDLKLND
jgi:hypothetical protein